MRNLCAGFFVVCRSNDALDGIGEDEVCDLIASLELTCERAAIDCKDKDLFCWLMFSRLDGVRMKEELDSLFT